MMMLQELQRRLDQTLGKPGSYHHGVDKKGHIKPMTIGARLYRLENQVCCTRCRAWDAMTIVLPCDIYLSSVSPVASNFDNNMYSIGNQVF
jgi:hypothetical protein